MPVPKMRLCHFQNMFFSGIIKNQLNAEKEGFIMDIGRFSLNKSLKTVWILFVLISVVIWMPRTDRMLSQEYPEVSAHVSLDENWKIDINSSVYKNVSLDGFRFKALNKGDKVIMQKELPQEWDISEGVLRLHIRQSAVNMYIEDELVYEYGHDRMLNNKTVGSGFLFINFPDEYKDKTIKIELDVSEDKAFTKFEPIHIYSWQNVYRALVTENRIPMFVGSFLVIFGLSTLIVTMFALVFSHKYVKLLCISAFSICIGLWTLCYYNVVLVYSIPLYSASLLEHIVLYLAPIPLLIYMYENVKNLKIRLLKWLYWLLLAVQVVFTAGILALHTFDVMHCAATIKYLHIIIIFHLIYFTVVLVMNLKSSQLTNRLYLIGVLIVFGCIGYDLASYNYIRYYGQSFMTLRGVSSIGVMIFIFILIIAFYINLTQKMMMEKERDFLIKRANTDELTQLYNRRYCSEYMEKIDVGKDSGYAVICFDLNNLKIANDTYGHSKGDILIKSAAEVILKTFQKHGIVGRIGGDEFIAVLKVSRKEEIEKLIDKFYKNILRKNREVEDLNMSIACGYALSCETDGGNIEKACQIADGRMYEDKKRYKHSGGNGR